jgi:hypothetical protein
MAKQDFKKMRYYFLILVCLVSSLARNCARNSALWKTSSKEASWMNSKSSLPN